MWYTKDLPLLIDLRTNSYLRWEAGGKDELRTAGISETKAWSLKAGALTGPKEAITCADSTDEAVAINTKEPGFYLNCLKGALKRRK